MEKGHQLNDGEKKIEKYIVKLKRLLGRGAYAQVYLGKCITNDQPVAVKVIDKKIFANHYNLKNIHSEIEIMKKVEHKNIVKLLDVYQTTNNMYIITEFCEQGDLMNFLKKRKRVPEKEAIKLLKDIIDGFRYLHSLGIIHRDLKPANILMKEGRCKISDFGFAKNLQNGDATFMYSIVGTPLYMSPQILNRSHYTSKSDLWSVGLIYYELLHGYTPWPANNEIQLINNIMTRQIVMDSSVSDKSKDWIRAALKIKQEDRMSWQEAFNHPLFAEFNKVDDNKENNLVQISPVYIDTSRGRSVSTTNRRDRSPNLRGERESQLIRTKKNGKVVEKFGEVATPTKKRQQYQQLQVRDPGILKKENLVRPQTPLQPNWQLLKLINMNKQ